MNLHVGKNFSFPREALRRVWAVLSVRGAGKTYTASVLVEEILEHKIMPVVVIDPMDGWWGLKSSADGKEPGYPVIVMGGKHADVPLESAAGHLVADFFIEHRQSLVMVFADGEHRWPKSQQVRFVAEFGARLYERNAGQLMFLVVDEADIFANQRPGKDELRCLGVMEDIVKRGRKPGIMPLLITQRSSNLNKNVLDETEMLVALRTMSPRDQGALDSWFQHLPKAQQTRRETLLETWSKLPDGTAYFWCPPMDLFQRVEVRTRKTFDSSATPEFGEKPREPKVVAPVDLEALKARMAATIERAKQEDPRLLRVEIGRLRTELAARPQVTIPAPIRVEVPILKEAQVKRLEVAADHLVGASDHITETAKALGDIAASIRSAIAQVQNDGVRSRALVGPGPEVRDRPSVPGPRSAPIVRQKHQQGTSLSHQARAMLEELARRYPVRLTWSQVAILSGYSTKSSTFRPSIRELIDGGHVEQMGRELALTERGIVEVNVLIVDTPASAMETIAMWIQKLPTQASAMLRALWEVSTHTMSREQLAERAGYSMTSSTWGSSLRLLERNGLVAMDEREVWISDIVMVPV